MTAAWWTKLHPLTRLALFLTVCLHAALGQEFLPQLLLFVGLLVLLFACGATGSHYRLLIWAHVLGLPGTLLLFVAIGYETTHAWSHALSWGVVEGARYALRLECLFLANLVLAPMDAARRRDTAVDRRALRAPFADGSPADLRYPTLSRAALAPLGATELVAHRCPVVRITNVPGA